MLGGVIILIIYTALTLGFFVVVIMLVGLLLVCSTFIDLELIVGKELLSAL